MRTKFFMAAAMAAAVAFAGCAKDGGENQPVIDNGDTNVVFVKASAPKTAETRGEGDRVQNNAITLGAGYLYFTDVNGVIRRLIEIKDSGAIGDDQKNVSDLQTGTTITNVSTAVTDAYVFANIPAATKAAMTGIAVNSNISAVKALSMAVGDLADASFGVTNVPQFGSGTVGYNAGNTKYETTINLQAMGSRLQILKLSAKAATSGAVIEEYKVDGIFVNNYFPSMLVSYGHTVSGIVNNLSDIAKYGGTNDAYAGSALADYTSGFSTQVGTFNSANIETNPATAGKVWAYNVWPTSAIPSVTNATIPHIVVRVSGISWNDGTPSAPTQVITEPRFITVKGMNNGSSLASIEPGKAYTFSDIEFDFDNLTTVPEESTIDTDVKVVEMPWAEVLVTPEL